jgi:hypothetical protein
MFPNRPATWAGSRAGSPVSVTDSITAGRLWQKAGSQLTECYFC